MISTKASRAAISAASLTLLMLLNGCGPSSSDGATPNVATSPTATPSRDDGTGKNPCLNEGNRVKPPNSSPEVSDYVGLSEQEAKAKAQDQQQLIRIAGRDGECSALTMDFRPERVNLYLEDDTVVAATLG